MGDALTSCPPPRTPPRYPCQHAVICVGSVGCWNVIELMETNQSVARYSTTSSGRGTMGGVSLVSRRGLVTQLQTMSGMTLIWRICCQVAMLHKLPWRHSPPSLGCMSTWQYIWYIVVVPGGNYFDSNVGWKRRIRFMQRRYEGVEGSLNVGRTTPSDDIPLANL